MSDAEIPPGNNDEAEEPESLKEESDEASVDTVNKMTRCQRIWLGVIIAVVLLVAIAAICVAIVPEARRMKSLNKKKNKIPTVTTSDLFEIDESIFFSNSTEPYDSIEEVQKDIEGMVMSMVNKIILNEANGDEEYYYDDDGFMFRDALFALDSGAEFADFSSAASPAVSTEAIAVNRESDGVFEGITDFDTYQQEAGAVKNDLVKSNGDYVFVGTDNRILVWNLEGNLTDEVEIESDTVSDDDDDDGFSRWISKPHIQALMMNPEGTKLIVVTDDPGSYRSRYANSESGDYLDIDVVSSYSKTRIIVYSIAEGSLTELSQSKIDGEHSDSYTVGNNVHIVTRMNMQTWEILKEPLSRWRIDPRYGMTDEEYAAAAMRRAEEEIIPQFVEKLVQFVTEDDEILLSRFTSFPGSMADYDAIAQISSFDVSIIDSTNDIEVNASKSLILRPGTNGYVYATDDWIWVSDQASIFSVDEQKKVQQTMLLGFRLNGASSSFAAVGSVHGFLLNQFAIDFVEDADSGKEYIRVATTQDFGSLPWMWLEMWRFDDLIVREEEEDMSRTKNEIVIFEVPNVEDSDQGISELIEVGSVEIGKKDETITAVRFFDNLSYVVTFERTDPFYVLDLSDPTNPEVLGELEVPGFSEFMHPITDDNSMLITVGQNADEDGVTTGFQISIFNSTVPTDPKLVDRFLLENQRGDSWSGSSASWDERAFRYVEVGDLGRLIIPVDIYFHGWDQFGNRLGDDFQGFMVFGIDLTQTENMITREIEINHAENSASTGPFPEIFPARDCFCGFHNIYLPERSMLFDGKLMTMKGNSVINTDLVSGQSLWDLSLSHPEDNSCCDDDMMFDDDMIGDKDEDDMMFDDDDDIDEDEDEDDDAFTGDDF
ncbi:unnamed protein product [Pseudo-nitzschia multistriata]|uniref:Uncharacterized protein n=1 Tax=Pseudo-nitzschia multistriata TaxID=183589 RepID=A0A448ZPD5_9STRA|nr:unnamed protein product [Pseudo-nitzschia multistriata]